MRGLVIALIFMIGSAAHAQSANQFGRYQMVAMPKTTADGLSNTVVILDTQDGELWKWIEGPSTNGGFNAIQYLGKLAPGSFPGDVVADVMQRKPKYRQ